MRVYISSPFLDLKGCRSKAYDALRRIGVDAIGMEDYVASDDRPVDKCLGDVKRCDAYVGLLAWRYGYVPDDAQCSVTELEYQTAVREQIPQLLFLLHPDAPWPRANVDRDPARIDALRGEWEKNRIVSHFQSCDELGALVTAAVARRLLEEREKGDARPSDDADDERRALQLQLDEIRRQLQFLTERIAGDGHSGEHAALPGSTSDTSAAPATVAQARGNPRGIPGPPLPAPAAVSSSLQVPKKSKSARGLWAAGGTALALAATLLLTTRGAEHFDIGFVRGDKPAQISTTPTDTFVIRGETTFSSRDSARLDSISPAPVVSRSWVPPFWVTSGILAVVLIASGIFTLRSSPHQAPPKVQEYELPWPQPHTRVANRPPRRSTAPPLSELSDRNRQFLDETQQQVERRLRALGEPPPA